MLLSGSLEHERFQPLDHLHRQIGSARKVVTRAFYGQEIRGRRIQGHGVPQLLKRAKRVFGAVDKKCRRAEIGEEGGTLVFRLLERMKRIREQKQSGGQFPFELFVTNNKLSPEIPTDGTLKPLA